MFGGGDNQVVENPEQSMGRPQTKVNFAERRSFGSDGYERSRRRGVEPSESSLSDSDHGKFVSRGYSTCNKGREGDNAHNGSKNAALNEFGEDKFGRRHWAESTDSRPDEADPEVLA